MSDSEASDLNSEEKLEDTAEILGKYNVIAVVGLSPDSGRDSHMVASFMKGKGYRIIPVNPNCHQILGERCYSSLREIPHPVEIVNVFLRPERVPPIAEEAIEIGAPVFWMQLGVRNVEAEARLVEAGIRVVADRCLKVEYLKTEKPEN
jgi:hypothetical protein